MLKIQVQIKNVFGKATYDRMKTANISALQAILFKWALFMNRSWKYRNYFLTLTKDVEGDLLIRIY